MDAWNCTSPFWAARAAIAIFHAIPLAAPFASKFENILMSTTQCSSRTVSSRVSSHLIFLPSLLARVLFVPSLAFPT